MIYRLSQDVTPQSFRAQNPQNTRKVALQNNNTQPAFQSNSQIKYENPISRTWEKIQAAFGSLALSSVLGVCAGAVAKSMKLKNPVAIAAGLVTAGVSALMTVPGALYKANVNSFVKDKEMDVFSRVKSLETSLSEQIDANSRNSEVPLGQNINDYFKFNVGRKGNGAGFIASA